MRFLYIIFACLFASVVLAQQPGSASRTELEKRRASIMESIKQTQEQLEATKQNKNATMGQLRALQSKLAERQKLISNINAEVSEINQNIRSSSQEITNLKQNLGMLKIRYAQSVRFAYKNRSSYNMVAFLFSSDDFNEAIRRLKYLKKYRDFRKEQAEQIRVTHSRIEKKLGILSTEKSQMNVLRTAEEQQKMVIQKETNEKDQVVRELKGKEKQLAKEIEKNRKAARQMDVAIQKIIQNEIRLAQKRAEEEALKQRAEEERRAAAASNTGGVKVSTGSGMRSTAAKETGSGGISAKGERATGSSGPSLSTVKRGAVKATSSFANNLTPEASALSAGFENNRGKLPWPVDKGYISQGFGVYRHPLEPAIEMENFGVDITTSSGASARAVFDGVVTNVYSIDGKSWNIMVSHGTYFTNYSGLSSTSVKANQKVTTKTPLGVVGENAEGSSVLNFQVWKVGKNNALAKMNPALWIAR